MSFYDALVNPKSCFIESLDSVRYTRLSDKNKFEDLAELDRNKKELQAEIELIYTLLLGQKVFVPEAHSFDSVGFLDIATRALDSRQRLPREAFDKSWIREPFFLFKRASFSSYLDMVYKRLNQPGFILSALSEINENIRLREEISNLLVKENLEGISSCLDKELQHKSSVKCYERLEKIVKMNQYFSGTESREAKNLPDSLKNYVDNLINKDDSVRHCQAEYGFNQIRNGLILLKEKNVEFYNRSEVRKKGKEYLNEQEYLGVVEYVDSCYNAVVYQATGADTGIMTTAETTSGLYVNTAQKISEDSANFGPRDRLGIWFKDEETQAFKEHLSNWKNGREDRWENIWEIMNTNRWVESVNEFNQAPEGMKREAYQAHIQELRILIEDYTSDVEIDEPKDSSQSIHGMKGNITLKFSFDESENGSEDVDGSTPGSDL